MKTSPEPNDDDVLLDAILADESWQTLDLSVRRDSLASLRAQRSRRKVFALARGIAVCAIVAAALLWWIQPRKSATTLAQKTAPTVASTTAFPSMPGVTITNFTDEQLLAMFPKGSCVIAEVNGRPRLIVLDEERVRTSSRFQ